MDLLAKFDTITIEPDNLISESDKIFCEAHQAAYENAQNALKELEYFWNDMQAQQQELLSPTDSSSDTYLISRNNLDVRTDAIRRQLHSLHARFIGQLTSYFSKAYHFSISPNTVEENLLPDKPSDRRAEDYEHLVEIYAQKMQELTLHYKDILEQISLQTNGRAFSEQALYELKGKCRQAAWNPAQKCADYVLKKRTIQFTGYACSYRSYYRGHDSWELSGGIRDILLGIAHFETGSFSVIPDGLSSPMSKYGLSSNEYDFPGCRKAESLKMYKNGRVDIKFSTEAYARQFIDDYLGTVYGCG